MVSNEVESVEEIDVTTDEYRAMRAKVQAYGPRRFAWRARTLLHRRDAGRLGRSEYVELRAIIDENLVRGGGLLA